MVRVSAADDNRDAYKRYERIAGTAAYDVERRAAGRHTSGDHHASLLFFRGARRHDGGELLYGFTMHYLRLLAEDVTEEQMTDIPHRPQSSGLVFIGHLAVCADFVPKLLSRRRFVRPSGMHYLPRAIPTTDRSRYPSKAELLAKNEEASFATRNSSRKRRTPPCHAARHRILHAALSHDRRHDAHLGHASGVAPRTVFDLATTARPKGVMAFP
jgi:hypothetical protein